MKPRLPHRLVVLGLAGFAALAMLLASNPCRAESQKLLVVASFSVIGDMVKNIAGDRVTLVTIVGPDGDTELYQPTLADSKAVAGASLVFFNDLNDEFEPWLEPLLKQAGFAGRKVVVSRGAKTLTAPEEHAISGKEMPAAIDQHAWLDPANGIVYVKNITEALVHSDPGHAAEYRANAAAYSKQIRAIAAWAKSEIAAVPVEKRRVIASHDSLEYLAKALGVTLISINGWTNKSEPSAAEVARLTQQVAVEHVRALFLDSITDPRVMERVAKETGAAIGGTLYGDALSKPGEGADSYLGMLRHDVETLKAGMLKN